MSNNTFRWGVLGFGNIANRFADGLGAIPDATLHAIGSRAKEKADEAGRKYGVKRTYGSYQELVDDPEVDAVYVATPHSGHKDACLLSIRAGKPVLCEKPFSINAEEAMEVVSEARDRKVFAMEAMWTRFFPLVAQIKRILAEGQIGTPFIFTGDFGFRAGFNKAGRLFNPDLGGGALLDVGVYPISFSSALFGTPSSVAGVATLGQTGVDEVTGITLGHDSGVISVIYTAVRVNTPQEAVILGTQGRIRVHSPFWVPTKMSLSLEGKPEEITELPLEGNGYNYQAVEVARCVRNGLLESPILPLDETIAVMKTMDTLRYSWGQKYPMEK